MYTHTHSAVSQTPTPPEMGMGRETHTRGRPAFELGGDAIPLPGPRHVETRHPLVSTVDDEAAVDAEIETYLYMDHSVCETIVRDETGEVRCHWEESLYILPVLFGSLFVLIMFMAQMWLNYVARTHAAGVLFHCKVWLLFASPFVCLFTFACMVYQKIHLTQDSKLGKYGTNVYAIDDEFANYDDPEYMDDYQGEDQPSEPWLKVMIPSILFSVSICAIMYAMKPVFGYFMATAGTAWCAFQLLLALYLDDMASENGTPWGSMFPENFGL